MHGSAYTIVTAACLLAMSNVHATPQDPARTDGTSSRDPAAVFAGAAAKPSRANALASKASALMPEGGTMDRVMQQAGGALNKFGMRSLTDDDYRAAYGNANVRERLGRTYAGGDANDFDVTGQSGSGWLDRMMRGGEGGLADRDWSRNAESLQGTMDDFSRQLMPALRELRDSVSEGLDRANRQR